MGTFPAHAVRKRLHIHRMFKNDGKSLPLGGDFSITEGVMSIVHEVVSIETSGTLWETSGSLSQISLLVLQIIPGLSLKKTALTIISCKDCISMEESLTN